MNHSNQELLSKLKASVASCEVVLANPVSTRRQLANASDDILGWVSTCNLSLKNFSNEEKKEYHSVYDQADHIAKRTRRFAALMKWEGC